MAGARLDQTAFAKITEIAAGRALDQIDGEFQQANFPRVVHAVNDRAERFVFALYALPGAVDHGVD